MPSRSSLDFTIPQRTFELPITIARNALYFSKERRTRTSVSERSSMALWIMARAVWSRPSEATRPIRISRSRLLRADGRADLPSYCRRPSATPGCALGTPTYWPDCRSRWEHPEPSSCHDVDHGASWLTQPRGGRRTWESRCPLRETNVVPTELFSFANRSLWGT